jgi:flavin-binding protein dodecin
MRQFAEKRTSPEQVFSEELAKFLEDLESHEELPILREIKDAVKKIAENASVLVESAKFDTVVLLPIRDDLKALRDKLSKLEEEHPKIVEAMFEELVYDSIKKVLDSIINILEYSIATGSTKKIKEALHDVINICQLLDQIIVIVPKTLSVRSFLENWLKKLRAVLGESDIPYILQTLDFYKDKYKDVIKDFIMLLIKADIDRAGAKPIYAFMRWLRYYNSYDVLKLIDFPFELFTSVFEEEPERIYVLIDNEDFIKAVKRFSRLANLVIETIIKHLEKLEEAAERGTIDRELYKAAKEKIKKFIEQISPVSVPEKLYELLDKPEFLTERVVPTEREETAVDFAKVELYYKLMDVLSKDPEFRDEKSLVHTYKEVFNKAIKEKRKMIKRIVPKDILDLRAFDEVMEDLVFGEGVSATLTRKVREEDGSEVFVERPTTISLETFEKGILNSLKEYLSRKIARSLAVELIKSTTLDDDVKKAIIDGLESTYKDVVNELSSKVLVTDVSLFVRRVYHERPIGPEKGILRVAVRDRVYEEILDPTSEMSIERAINDIVARAVEDLVKDKELHKVVFQKVSEKTGEIVRPKPSLYVEKPGIYGLDELHTLITDLTNKFARIEDIGLSKQALADILAETDRALSRLQPIFKKIPTKKLRNYLRDIIKQLLRGLKSAIDVVKRRNKEIGDKIDGKIQELKDTISNFKGSLRKYQEIFESAKSSENQPEKQSENQPEKQSENQPEKQPYGIRDVVNQFLQEIADNIAEMDKLMFSIFEYLLSFAVFSVKEEQHTSKISNLMNKYLEYRDKIEGIYQEILNMYKAGEEDIDVILEYLPEIQVPEEVSGELIKNFENINKNINLDLSNLLEDRERAIENKSRAIEDESQALEELYRETEGEYEEFEEEEEIKGLLE